MKMTIHPLILPKYLMQLITEGRWHTPADQTRLEQLTGITGINTNFDFHTLSNKSIRWVNEDIHLYDDPQVARIYGLASSNRLGHEILDSEILDVDKAIYLASNVHEDVICLDYRSSIEEPQVVVSSWEPSINLYRWRKIANNIKEFADYLGL